MVAAVYVLALAGGKYYVGKASDSGVVVEAHRTGKGAAWTRLHKPLPGIEQLIPATATSSFEEEKVVKEYMLKYGIANVRGGVYSNTELTKDQIRMLKIELWSVKMLQNELWGARVTCSRAGHSVQQCHARADVYGERLGADQVTRANAVLLPPQPSEPPQPPFFSRFMSALVDSITSR
jgi:predicted GIY-YIG superfamily endonuclease